MGNLNVVEKLAPLASHMVASSEVESSGQHSEYDAQNLQVSMTDLLNHPDMTASELANHMVAQADAGANDGFNIGTKKNGTGTPTLAHFDLGNTLSFNTSLNELGTALARASSDPAEMAAINKAIDEAPRLPAQSMSVSGHPNEDRDLKSFAKKLMQSVNSGEIDDPSLKKTLQNFLSSEDALVPSYHGATDGNYNTQGGLTAFLPDLRIRDTSNKDIASNLAFGQMQYMADKNNSYATLQHRDTVIQNINDDLNETQTSLGANHTAEITKLRGDVSQLQAAKTDVEFRSALALLEDDSNGMAKSDFGRDLIRIANTKNRDSRFGSESLALPGWQAFMEALRKTT